MKVIKNIDIYLTNKRPVRTIDVVQGDTGIQLVFTLKDFTIPSGSSATLFVEKPSGKFVYQNFNITVSGNTITIDLENQALTEYGDIPYQVSIENGTDTVTTFTGMMIVQRSLKDSGAIKSGTVVRAFDELTVEKLAEFQARAETAANGVIATIPEDYTAMTAKVNGLANAIKGKLSGAVVRADDVSPVEHYPKVKVICPENVDPSMVKVTRCGKNMLNIRTVNVQAVSGVTFSFDEEGKCTVSGTNSEENIIHVYATTSVSGIVIPKGTTVTVSGLPDNRKCCLRVFTNTTIGNTVGGLQGDYYETQTITVTEDTIIQNVLIRVAGGATVNAVFKPMLEIGDTATEFERFKELVKYTPNADGTIEGITSVSPTMTLLTDTEGVTIECEYNKDTNKVVQKLVNAISAMGGEVTI